MPATTVVPDCPPTRRANRRQAWAGLGAGFVLGGLFGAGVLAGVDRFVAGSHVRTAGIGASLALAVAGGGMLVAAARVRRGAPAQADTASRPATTLVLPADPRPDDPGDARVRQAFRNHRLYTVDRRLGAGGCGVVYLARHRLTGRPVVLKTLHPHLANTQAVQDQWFKETRASLLLRHEHIVQAVDELDCDGMRVLVLEYIRGEDLDAVIERCGPLPPWRVARYLRQAALGLEHAHAVHRLVHRDVKPGNLMLAADTDTVKVLDFGLVKVTGAPPTGLSVLPGVFGTPLYMAPEQANDTRAVDHRADVYALGCTAYHLLAGRPPFEGDNPLHVMFAHQTRTADPLTKVRSEVPDTLAAVVERMMAKSPDDRYQTHAEVAAALEPFAADPSRADTPLVCIVG